MQSYDTQTEWIMINNEKSQIEILKSKWNNETWLQILGLMTKYRLKVFTSVIYECSW